MPAEARKLVKLLSVARESGEEYALATVVGVDGSSYRKPGARMIVTRGGVRAGTVSGGCLEAEVSSKIWWHTESGPQIRQYSTSFEEDSLQPSYGMGCSGTLSILLERGSSAEVVLEALRLAVEQRIPSAIVTVISTNSPRVALGGRLVVTHDAPNQAAGLDEELNPQLLPIALSVLRSGVSMSQSISFLNAEIEIFAEYIAPPPALFVFGAGDDARPLVHLAHLMGWEVTVTDGRSNLATRERFPAASRVETLDLDDPLKGLPIGPRDAAVLLTHSFAQDLEILRALLPIPLAYLGALGPRSRTKRVVDELATLIDVDSDQAMEILKSPVGLDLGRGSPEIIALSIIAEIQSVLSNGTALPLHRAISSGTAVVQH